MMKMRGSYIKCTTLKVRFKILFLKPASQNGEAGPLIKNFASPYGEAKK
jgi:hypothetical protein